MLFRKRMLVAALVVGLVLAGCSGKGDPEPSGSTQVRDQTVAPAWSVRTQPVSQPQLVDGVLLGEVFDADVPVGHAVVVWDPASGEELWRHDGWDLHLFDVEGRQTVGYLVYRDEAWSVVLADLRTGEESVAAMPAGQRASFVQECEDGGVCVGSYTDGADYPRWFQVDPAALTVNSVEWPSTQSYPDGITVSYDASTLVVSYQGDETHAAWTRPVPEMFAVDTSWQNWLYHGAPWSWYGDREMLLGYYSAAPEGTRFDRDQEYVTGAFAPDGTTLWNAFGYPCSSGQGGWTTSEVQVLCVNTGTAQYTIDQQSDSYRINPNIDDGGRYWVGVDMRTGEQRWRFPKEGAVPDAAQVDAVHYAPIKDIGHVVVRTEDGAHLLDVATGKAEALDPDGAFLCPQSAVEDAPDGGSVSRSFYRICGLDGSPVVAPWPVEWVRLAAVTDGEGRYYLATASQLVAFDL